MFVLYMFVCDRLVRDYTFRHEKQHHICWNGLDWWNPNKKNRSVCNRWLRHTSQWCGVSCHPNPVNLYSNHISMRTYICFSNFLDFDIFTCTSNVKIWIPTHGSLFFFSQYGLMIYSTNILAADFISTALKKNMHRNAPWKCTYIINISEKSGFADRWHAKQHKHEHVHCQYIHMIAIKESIRHAVALMHFTGTSSRLNSYKGSKCNIVDNNIHKL